MQVSDIKVGNTIQFIYEGGTYPGKIRTVDVQRVSLGYIDGYCHFVGGDRRFSVNKIRNLQFNTKIDDEITIFIIKEVFGQKITFRRNDKLDVNIFIDENGVLDGKITDVIQRLKRLE